MVTSGQRNTGKPGKWFSPPALIAVLILLCMCQVLKAASEQAWHDIDIVPMPKQIVLTGQLLPLSGTLPPALVLGAAACLQSRIGADWINRELTGRGGEALAVVDDVAQSADRWQIVIGTRGDSPLIELAVQARVLDVGDNNPGLRGYEIRIERNSKRVYLAGADNIGALYACVTFGELLTASADAPATVVWREAEVRDWPDSIHGILGGYTVGTTNDPGISEVFRRADSYDGSRPEIREAYLAAIQQRYDLLLRWKMGTFQYTRPRWEWHRNRPPESRALIKEGIEYGKERGIGAMFYALKPFVCLKADHPHEPDLCTQARISSYEDWIRCWSKDELRREYARALARFIAEVGLTDIGFHDTDTGGFDNPTGWNERCDLCRQRWGDDFASATANKHKIFAEEILGVVPDARVHFTLYPYNISIFDQTAGEHYMSLQMGNDPMIAEQVRKYREQYTAFWQRVHEGIPERNVTFCIRENLPGAVDGFRALIGDRGVFTWDAIGGKAWATYFHHGPEWTGTFMRGPDDFLFPQYLGPDQGFVPLIALAVREYAWNPRAPGAGPWQMPVHEQRWQRGETSDHPLFTVVLPHVARNFFGREIAGDVVEAVTQNVNPWHIYDIEYSRQFNALKTAERMSWQADRATIAAAAMDRAWTTLTAADNNARRLPGPEALLTVVYLRETLHACTWLARLRAQNLLARELALKGLSADARAAIAAGERIADETGPALDRLLAERPEHLRKLIGRTDPNRYLRLFGFQYRMAEAGKLRLADMRERLEQTAREVDALVEQAGVPAEVVDCLARDRVVRCLNLAGEAAPVLDGKLDDPCWHLAYPAESFFVHKQERTIARGSTRARLLHDAENLYVAYVCEVPPGLEVADNDWVELFLKSPGMGNDYVHFTFAADGSCRHQRGRYRQDLGAKVWRTDREWTAPGVVNAVHREGSHWLLEARIPFESIDARPAGNGWSINLARACRIAENVEWSSIVADGARDFHDPPFFRRLHWTDEPWRPTVQAEIVRSERTTQTLPDRIATMIEFGVSVDSDTILNRLRVTAETYDQTGKVNSRKQIAAIGQVLYRWQPQDRFDALYDQVIEKGGLRILFDAEEGRFEKWLRFGGWDGAGTEGALLKEIRPSKKD